MVIGLILFLLPRMEHISPQALTGYIIATLYLMGPLAGLLGSLSVFSRANVSLRKIEELGLALKNGWLHDQLQGAGRQIQVAHPGKVRMIFRAKRKNDRIDARKLALLTFVDQVPHRPSVGSAVR